MNIPLDFPEFTPCWFCNKNLQSDGYYFRDKNDLSNISQIRLSCLNHPSFIIIYKWIKDREDGWMTGSVLLDNESHILFSDIDPKSQEIGITSWFRRHSTGDFSVNKISELPPYWIFTVDLNNVLEKLEFYLLFI